MKKYFIDLGAHDGCSIRKFKKEIDVKNEYYCYSFEPNKSFNQCFKDFTNHTFYEKAAYITDDSISMNIDRQNGFGSSIIMEKKDRHPGQLDRRNPDNVECIDFSKWIRKTFNITDYIILKMDIEGSEYDILEKMIRDQSILLVNELYIEWHNKKLNIPNIDVRHKKLLDELSKYNLIIDSSWCAIKYSSLV